MSRYIPVKMLCNITFNWTIKQNKYSEEWNYRLILSNLTYFITWCMRTACSSSWPVMNKPSGLRSNPIKSSLYLAIKGNYNFRRDSQTTSHAVQVNLKCPNRGLIWMHFYKEGLCAVLCIDIASTHRLLPDTPHRRWRKRIAPTRRKTDQHKVSLWILWN